MKNNKKKIYIISVISFVILITIGSILYFTVYLDSVSKINIVLNGEKELSINLLGEYIEAGASATYRNEDITNLIEISSNIDNTKIGEYNVEYKIRYKDKEELISRKINIVDNINPELTLNGKQEVSIYVGNSYNEEGASAIDNYDGDISDKILIEGEVNTNKEGEYKITYKVSDSSNNESIKERVVKVVTRPIVHKDGVAVLNYHFFYQGADIGDANCMNIEKFESHLKYLKDNDYKALTMEEFKKWMYGEIEIPQKSVLITIDDGAMGTGKHNGNLLIPALEKYQMHATLFLITGWWAKSNYESDYLDIESHTHDMHTEKYCEGVTRGAKMLCLSKEEVLNDLRLSIATTGSDTAFCYPFFAYNNQAIENLKEAGFKLGFAGGGRKATRSSNKYAIPRFQITKNITLDQFINIIS